MPLFRPSLNSNFLKTRTFFFVSAVVLHIVATLVAAVDVTSDTTKASSSRSAVSSFNLAIHLSSFLIVAFLSILDSLDQESRWRISSVSAEVAFINFVALAQFINAVVFAMLMPKFGCGKASGPDFQPCTTLSRALIALNAMIAALYIIFDVWFTGTAIVASKEDKAVWKSQTRFYPWDGRILPTKSSPPLDILGAGATMAQANPRDRLTWVNPMHDQGSSSPKLPPPPLPPKSNYPHYTRRTQQALPQDVADATPSSFLRPLSLVSNLPRIQNTPPLRVGNNRPGHLRLHSESSAMSGRYPVISPTHNVSKSEDWLTPGYTYGREYVDQRVVRSALTPSPATSQRIKLPQHPAPTHRRYMSYKEAMDGRYPNKF